MKRLLCFFALFCCVAFYAGPAKSAEEILQYHSDIRIQEDARVFVTESIIVRAEGKKIKRGIFRDFPVRYKNPDGGYFRIGFKILSVRRNGEEEPYHIKSSQNGKRVYIGTEDTFIPHGMHQYEITYLTYGVVSFYDDVDEIYWNVTGNDWDFPINEASARLFLPGDAAVSRYSVYTGPKGSTTGHAYNAYRDPVSGGLSVHTARALGLREGLTIAAGWPKNIVTQPSDWQRLKWRMAENKFFTAAALYVPLLFLYLFMLWLLIGRDPSRGTIIPEFAPPDGLSPAVISYIRNMGLGYSDRREAFSAALINLAVKGRIKIHRRAKNTYDLIRINTDTAGLSAGEAYILYRMFHRKNMFTIERAYDTEFVEIMDGFTLAIEGEYGHHYFLSNSKYVTAAYWISAPMIFVMMVCMVFGPEYIAPSFVLIGATLFLHMIFYALMKAPTMLGREKMDRIDGFRLYLKTAEKSRLDFLHPPDMTPELFEKYLPYAVVLGVENQWVNYFKKSLPIDAQQNYRPHWYQGYGKTGFRLAEIGKSFSSNLSATMSSAATAPSSSGGGFSGGGGSSGGGFGGGGGGGW